MATAHWVALVEKQVSKLNQIYGFTEDKLIAFSDTLCLKFGGNSIFLKAIASKLMIFKR